MKNNNITFVLENGTGTTDSNSLRKSKQIFQMKPQQWAGNGNLIFENDFT